MKTAPTPAEQRSAGDLREALEGLRDDVLAQGAGLFEGWRPQIKRADFLPSAQNLAYYIALRRHELRDLQLELMPWGLSSLGRCEARVVENLDAVIAALERMDTGPQDAANPPSSTEYFRGHSRLRENTDAALGAKPSNRDVRIMVTLPTQAAEDYGLVLELTQRGMDIARINCAHDEADAWLSMAEHTRRAAAESGRPCRVCMDICGPRARTASVITSGADRVHVGDAVLMTAAPPSPSAAHPLQFQCTLPGVLECLELGHEVWIDEGNLGLVVDRKDNDGALLRVTETRPKGSKLRSGKGLNFPQSEIVGSPLTQKDLRDLDVIAEMADIVGYSFVQRPGDILQLQDELARRAERPESVALVAKIETRLALRNLPELIVQAAGVQPLAVMIARGDLAVETGYRRMAELQEEILWLCEAAHVPVIWATQVLDRFVHKGMGARAEMTDAAMAERAECVMLNKGPFVADAVGVLDDVLSRMEGHQFKKASRMRALHSW